VSNVAVVGAIGSSDLAFGTPECIWLRAGESPDRPLATWAQVAIILTDLFALLHIIQTVCAAVLDVKSAQIVAPPQAISTFAAVKGQALDSLSAK
jgi:hypothetical protein